MKKKAKRLIKRLLIECVEPPVRSGMSRMLSIVYSAADVFVFPSLQKTFGQRALETMACRTPVIGFDGIGCIRDLIPCGLSGRRVPTAGGEALRSAIAELLQDSVGLTEMSVHCRRIVVEKFNLELQENVMRSRIVA
ncbi:MAG: glycosyltransferase [Candidatus Acidiferrum sp.]